MGRGLRVLPWAGIVVLVVAVAADSPPSVHVSSSFDDSASAPVFVFPDALDEETRLRLLTPERNSYGFPNFDVRRWRLDAGGVPSAEAEVDGVRRSMSKHYVSVTNEHRERMRVLDVWRARPVPLPSAMAMTMPHAPSRSPRASSRAGKTDRSHRRSQPGSRARQCPHPEL
jgi:hypothetical protein